MIENVSCITLVEPEAFPEGFDSYYCNSDNSSSSNSSDKFIFVLIVHLL